MQIHLHHAHARKTLIIPLYLASLFLSLHYAILLYINSSFLTRWFSESGTGLLYVVGAIMNLVLLFHVRSILRRMSVRKFLFLLSGVTVFSMLLLLSEAGAAVIGFAFIIHTSATYLMAYCFDLYLEGISKDSETGRIRTRYLTIANLMIALSPVITGWLVAGSDYRRAYAFSLFLLAPLIVIIFSSFKLIYARAPARRDRPAAWKSFISNGDLRNIFASRILLEFFYSWMIVYTPIYLNRFIGFSWNEIGVIFGIMLIAFVIFEIPAGKLADRSLGEKEMLSLGFIIMATFTFLMPFIPASAGLAVWAGTLFMTRVGASLIEAMTDTYFFKKVDASHEDYIGFYRAAQPFAYITGPLTATIALAFLPYNAIFIVLACIMMTGLRYSLALKDTK